jgi:LDH2 family malate/lactate/ureidoglycolate dehydrogenase
LTAECLVDSNLTGYDPHGVRLLSVYVRRIENGTINPAPNLRVTIERPASATVDGDNGIGPVVAAFSMDKAIAKARSAGVSAVAACRSNHFGAAAWSALRAAKEGLIGVAASNGSAALAPWGGARAFFGANPIAFAIPVAQGDPIVFDMSTSVSARARIRRLAAAGQQLPEGWAIDAQGRPTTNAEEALRGALLPFGGHKGYGLAMMLEILSGALSAAGFSHQHRDLYSDTDGPQGLGHFFLTLSPTAFISEIEFQTQIATLVDALTKIPPSEGTEGVRVPGDSHRARRTARLTNGISLPDDEVAELTALGRQSGVRFPSALNQPQVQ